MKNMMAELPSIAILLCTYNGGKYLAEQLDSFDVQSHSNWRLWVSDDNSQDNTLDIIEDYRKIWGEQRISLRVGPQKGFAQNFFSLVNDCSIQEDYYAYSDQDDIWKQGKLARALEWLAEIPEGEPGLYCSRTCLVDEKQQKKGFSPLFTRFPSFENAIVQNIGGGNTMVFNNAARHLLQQVDVRDNIVSHDWLTYQIVSGCGGKVFYDRNPTLSYRQHKGNLIGANNDWNARLKRIEMLYRGEFRDWNTCNLAILNKIKPKLTINNRIVLEQLLQIRSDNFLSRLLGLRKLNIYRQTKFGNLALIVAIIFKRF